MSGPSSDKTSPAVRVLAQNCLAAKGHDPVLVEELSWRLGHFTAASSLGLLVESWLDLQSWVRGAGRKLRWWRTGEGRGSKKTRRLLRIEMFAEVLEEEPAVREQVQDSIRQILSVSQSTDLFATAGIPSDRGFIPELWERLMSRLLPEPRDDQSVEKLLQRQFPTRREAAEFNRLPPEIFERVAHLLFPLERGDIAESLAGDLADGFRLLASRVQAHGLSQPLRARSREVCVNNSPFYRLNVSSQALADAWQEGAGVTDRFLAWTENAKRCQEEADHISERLESEGVSVEIVVSLEVMRLCLKRMELMARVMTAPYGRARMSAVRGLLDELIQAALNDRSIRYLLSSGTSLLHRKIVERSGQTGQHYIALTLKEYRHLWLAAAGGGLLTAVTAAVKMAVASFHLPPFPAGFLYGLNYSLSFLIMQWFGFVLATKQPAMTAAHLADIMREKRGEERRDEIADFSALICQSQIAAAMGNVIMVTVGAYGMDYVWRLIFGTSMLNREGAEHVFHILSPLDSGTVFFAAVTGVILWMASLIGGWFDNFSVYHRLPQAIRDHPFGEIIGTARLDRLAGVVERNMSGWGTNVSLGMMLGFAPVLGLFLGIPLDVRHVTLSTGQLALACASLQHQWFFEGWFVRAVSGIAIVFVLNLSVSFLFSFITAARAYRLTSREIFELLAYIGKRMVRRPQQFLLPPRANGSSAGAGERTH